MRILSGLLLFASLTLMTWVTAFAEDGTANPQSISQSLEWLVKMKVIPVADIFPK